MQQAFETFYAGCLRELSDGTAAAYAAVRDSRLPALLKSGQTDVHFSATVHQSPLLYPSDISTILLLYNVDNFLLQ